MTTCQSKANLSAIRVEIWLSRRVSKRYMTHISRQKIQKYRAKIWNITESLTNVWFTYKVNKVINIPILEPRCNFARVVLLSGSAWGLCRQQCKIISLWRHSNMASDDSGHCGSKFDPHNDIMTHFFHLLLKFLLICHKACYSYLKT